MITAYLTFNGNTEEVFNFYKSVLGGEFSSFQRFGDTEQGNEMSDEDKHKIMHLMLSSPSGNLMGSDHLDHNGPFVQGNNISLSLHPKSEEEANTLFNGLSKNGKITMPLSKVFWGALFGMFTDQFGVNWMVNYQAE